MIHVAVIGAPERSGPLAKLLSRPNRLARGLSAHIPVNRIIEALKVEKALVLVVAIGQDLGDDHGESFIKQVRAKVSAPVYAVATVSSEMPAAKAVLIEDLLKAGAYGVCCCYPFEPGRILTRVAEQWIALTGGRTRPLASL